MTLLGSAVNQSLPSTKWRPWAPLQGREVDDLLLLLVHEVDDGDGVEAAEAVVGDVGGAAIGGGGHFMRIVADGRAGDHLESGRIDDGYGVVLLGEDEERGGRRGLRGEESGGGQGAEKQLWTHGFEPQGPE